jgi:hypothetical protein
MELVIDLRNPAEVEPDVTAYLAAAGMSAADIGALRRRLR